MASSASASAAAAAAANPDGYTVELQALCVVLFVLSIVILAARITARRVAKVPLAADDWVAGVGWFLTIALQISTLVVSENGGVRYAPPTREQLVTITRTSIAVSVFYTTSLVTMRFSVLLLYRRIFGMRASWFRFGWWAVFAYNCLLGLTMFIMVAIVTAGQTSTSGNFDFLTNLSRYGSVITEFLGVLLDIACLSLAIGVLRTLQQPWALRLAVMGIFSLGLITTIIAVGRGAACIIQIQQGSNWDAVYGQYINLAMCVAESTATMICATLIVLRPLLSRMREVVSTVASSMGRTVKSRLNTTGRSTGYSAAGYSLHSKGRNLDSIEGSSQVGILKESDIEISSLPPRNV